MSFPHNAWRIPLTKRVVSWYGWRSLIGEWFPFADWMPWAIKGRVWNWCFPESNFDWRAQRAKERAA